MTQPGLIKKILATTGLEEYNPNQAPSAQAGLAADTNGPPSKEPWSYSSVVGMLLYLATNTQPYISFAVSQVARFNSAPKQSHAAAVKMIVQYLKGTCRNLGLQPLISLLQYVNRLGFEICSVNKTRKLGYVNLNRPKCSARVTESLALTDGSFCRK